MSNQYVWCDDSQWSRLVSLVRDKAQDLNKHNKCIKNLNGFEKHLSTQEPAVPEPNWKLQRSLEEDHQFQFKSG